MFKYELNDFSMRQVDISTRDIYGQFKKDGNPGVLSTQICMLCAYDHGEMKIKLVANFQKQKCLVFIAK